jgi:STAS domain
MHALLEVTRSLAADGVRLVLANPSKAVQAALRRGEVLDAVGQEWVFVRTADAVATCVAAVAKAGSGGLIDGDASAKQLAATGPAETKQSAPGEVV